MRLFTRFAVATLALYAGLMSSAASASVILNWVTVSTSDALRSVSARMVISDRAWEQGHLRVDLGYGDWPARDSDLQSFVLEPNGAMVDFHSPEESSLFEGEFDADMTFSKGLITGSLYANDTETEVAMASSTGLWRITESGSDDPAIGDGCYYDHSACTAQGIWLPDIDSLPVAEPANLALFGSGLVLLAFGSWRKHDRRRA